MAELFGFSITRGEKTSSIQNKAFTTTQADDGTQTIGGWLLWSVP